MKFALYAHYEAQRSEPNQTLSPICRQIVILLRLVPQSQSCAAGLHIMYLYGAYVRIVRLELAVFLVPCLLWHAHALQDFAESKPVSAVAVNGRISHDFIGLKIACIV